MLVTVWKDFEFQAAHKLSMVPDTHRCSRVHGHGYRVRLKCVGPLESSRGWVIDYAEIKKAFEAWLAVLDHSYLNGITGLSNPTAENLAIFIAERVAPGLPSLHSVVVQETVDVGAEVLISDLHECSPEAAAVAKQEPPNLLGFKLKGETI